MFKKRRERKQAELHEELGAALRDPDAAVRAKAAVDAAEAADLEWALRELAAAVAREPWTDDFHETVVDGFCAALRRDTAVRQRVEGIFAGHLDDPEGCLRAWTGFVEELGGPPALREVGEDVRDDMRARLTYLRSQGWTPEGLDGAGRPGSFTRELAFDFAVLLTSLVVRRNEPLPAEDAERVRTETGAILERALATAPDSDVRLELIAPLCDSPDDEAWTDRARHGLQVDETLDLCMSADADRATLGVETLHHQVMRDDLLRRGRTREALDHLLAREQDPFVLNQLLGCYVQLHVAASLPDPPVDLFLGRLRHADDTVRSAAAFGLGPLTLGTPEEGRVVDALVALLDDDPEDEVRGSAAESLAGLDRGEEPVSRTVSDALERHADASSPKIRAAALQHALENGATDAYDRLLREFDSPDVDWRFLSAYELAAMEGDFSLPDDIRPRLVERLERLETTGWAARCEDPDGYPDPDRRAEMLSDLLAQLRARA
ncbi:HEAT repeat domain-containing protein [Streptomyces sp. NPDC004732]|uniref:HEAT repeat domain-containing protein n=1 Tax=Streptomyces sp. NPDC004732 TaxID=3154290 RepID=UPI00339FB725